MAISGGAWVEEMHCPTNLNAWNVSDTRNLFDTSARSLRLLYARDFNARRDISDAGIFSDTALVSNSYVVVVVFFFFNETIIIGATWKF